MARPQPPAAPSRPQRAPADGVGLVAALAVALALRLALAVGTAGLTMDSPLYVRMAEWLRHGVHEGSPAHQGYPLLVALASFLTSDREWPGRLVSLVASLALVALVHDAARRRVGPRGAALAAGLVALHPLLAIYGVAVMTEATFLTLVCAGFAALDRGQAKRGGAWLGAAWWVRPEALVLAPLAVLLAPLTPRARMTALALAVVVALPHSALLRVQQGHWSLSPKTSLVHAPPLDPRADEWRLADARAFADTVDVRTRLARDGGAILRAWPVRFGMHARRALEAWPLPLLLLALVGLARREGRGPWLAPLALPFVYPLLAAPPDLRFASALVPGLALAATAGAGALVARGRAGRLLGLALVATGAIAIARGPATRLARAFDDGPMASLRGAGAWLAANSPPEATIMDRKSYVAFFADRRHVQLPDEPLDTLLDYARREGVDYLVVEEYVVRGLRPQLAPLLDARYLAREPRVRLVHAVRPAPGDGVAVLAVVRD